MIRRIVLVLGLLFATMLNGQTNSTTLPRLIRFSGNLPANTSAYAAVTGVTFALYKDQEGGSPLWLETQNVSLDAARHYSVLLGAASKDGLPAELFSSNEARWLGVKPEGENELPRVLLVSVPYAIKAGDAETLGGKPLSAFVLNNTSPSASSTASGTTTSAIIARAFTTPTATAGAPPPITANFVPLFFDNTGTLGNSVLFQSAGNIGINTTSPQGALDVNGGTSSVIFRDYAAQLISPVNNGPQFAFVNAATPTAANWRFGVPGVANSTGFFIFDNANQNAPFFIEQGTPQDTFHLQAAGKVGIGTAAPSNKLTVAGTIESTSGGFKFPDGSVLASAMSPTVTASVTYTGSTNDQVLRAVQNQTGYPACTSQGQANCNFTAAGVPSGLRGDSTSSTGYAAGVFGSASSIWAPGVAGVNLSQCDPTDTGNPPICKSYGVFGWSVLATRGTGVWGEADSTTGDNVGAFGTAAGDQGTGVEGWANNSTTGDGTGVYGLSDAPNGTGVWGYATNATGNTAGVYGLVSSTSGYGGLFDGPFNSPTLIAARAPATSTATSPTRVFRVDSTGTVYANVYHVGNADFAEAVDALGGLSKYEPGDVMMIDNTGTRRLTLSTGAYSTKVAGIYSTKPGILGSEHSIDDPTVNAELPLAIVGIVPCKVSAENGAIHAGDLLVTASRPGYAMKGTDRKKMLGAVVGKALGSLDKGTGTIEVLVSLH